MKIFVVGGALNYADWISDDIDFVNNVDDADLIMLTGGEDTDPSIYGELRNHKTYSNIRRDLKELKIFNECQKLNKPMLGICKGAQTLTAFQPKGRLVQHVENHAVWNGHDVKFNDGKILNATSTHHQMMYPFNVDKYELIAWSAVKKSDNYEFGPTDEILTSLPENKEPEIVFYPETRCLSCQSHPEMMDKDDPFVVKMRKLVKLKLL